MGNATSSSATKSGPLESLVNGITVMLKNSPINEGKKWLAKLQAGDYDVVATRAKIDKLIEDNAVVVFSWTGCPFCLRAKAVLDEQGARYLAVELDTMGAEGKAIRAELAEKIDRTSVPAVWIAGEFAGGCNDGGLGGLLTLKTQGKLAPLLAAAGAA